MKLVRTLACGTCLMLFAGAAFAQTKKAETSVEDLYMSNVQDVIITELAVSPEYDNKLVALQYLEESVASGKITKEQRVALESLAGEGITKKARTGNRVTNNFPDVRRHACELLGKVPSKESKDTLLVITKDDPEPMVVSAAVRSLGEIGMNDNDEVLATIEFIQKRYAALNPTSSLANDILAAYEKLAPTAVDRNALIQSIAEISANYRFATAVRLRAQNLLRELQETK